MDTMTAPRQAPESPQTPGPSADHEDYVPVSPAPFPVNAALTPKPRKRDVPRVPCTECGTEHPESQSGLCRACWHQSDGPRRNATAKLGQGEQRKTDSAEQVAMARRFLRSACRRAASEDPSVGLAPLLAFQRELAQMINETGREVLANFDMGIVARELGVSKQAVDQRWGTK